MDRYKRIKQLNTVMEDEGSALVWFGLRGSDAKSLALFKDHVGGSFSIFDRHLESEPFPDREFFVALEDYTLKRRQSRGFGEDLDSRAGELLFRRKLEECFKSIINQGKIPTVISYEPEGLLDTIIMQDGVAKQLGIGLERYREVSKKPKMERQLRELGVPVIPWKPVTSFEDILAIRDSFESLIIRRDGGSSGQGIVSLRQGDNVDDIARVVREMRGSSEAAISVAPLYEGAVSLNASAVVFPQKSQNTPSKVATFPINAQLIGSPELTTLEFGYAGNDYAFTGGLSNEILLECDEILTTIGQHLGSQGYVGAFGVDFLMTQQGQVLFTEVNARFQGSTRLISRIAGRADQSDVMMEHMAATMGLPYSPSLTAPQWADAIVPFSQMYLRNTTDRNIELKVLDDECEPVHFKPNIPVTAHVEYEMTVENPDVQIEPGAVVERIVLRGAALSSDGRTLRDGTKALLAPAEARYQPSSPELSANRNNVQLDEQSLGH